MTLSFASHAHDPKLHAKKAEKANCAPFEKMKKDNKKMDMTDPVMLAMMKKCEKQAQKGEHSKQAMDEKMDHKKMDHKKMDHKEMKEKKKDDDHQH